MVKNSTSTLEELLSAAIGLDSQSIGGTAIFRAARERMKAVGIDLFDEYEKLAASTPSEMQALVESLVVPETWFLRHPESFSLMLQKIKEWWPPAPAGSRIRILSIPCSTGEEPYSVAMTLLREGFDPSAFEIEGIDLSRVSLQACEKAQYGKNSFREGSLEKLEPFFEQSKGKFVLQERVKKMVNFRWGNLVAPDFLLPLASYDVIFCRNLLIYLTLPAQQQVVQMLKKALRDEGLFFCGPAEATILGQNGFSSLKVPLAFAFQKKVEQSRFPSAEEKRKVKLALPNRPARPPLPQINTVVTRVPVPSRSLGANWNAPTQEKLEHSLDQARANADKGDFAAAADICHGLLEKNQFQAEAHHILGLVHDAQGHVAEAIACYKKVLYLAPNHEEALLHLALLKHKTGDLKGARILQQRATRLADSSKNR